MAIVSFLVLFLCSTKLLYKSAEDCNPGLTKFFISLHGDVNAQYNYMTPLMSMAAMPKDDEKCAEVFNMLIDAGADVNATNLFETTPLFYALLINNDIERSKLLINAGADVNIKYSKYSIVRFEEAPLILEVSCYQKDELVADMMKLLIDAGADVNAIVTVKTGIKNLKWIRTPLTFAVENDSNKLVRLLINRGADVKFKGFKDQTPLHVCVESPWYDNFENRLDIIKALAEAGADVNAKDSDENTALHALSYDILGYKEKDEAAKQLIEVGADVNIKNNHGYTPLSLITRVREDESVISRITIAKILLNAGADVNITANDGDTALHGGVSYNEVEFVKLLIDIWRRCKYCE